MLVIKIASSRQVVYLIIKCKARDCRYCELFVAKLRVVMEEFCFRHGLMFQSASAVKKMQFSFVWLHM